MGVMSDMGMGLVWRRTHGGRLWSTGPEPPPPAGWHVHVMINRSPPRGSRPGRGYKLVFTRTASTTNALRLSARADRDHDSFCSAQHQTIR